MTDHQQPTQQPQQTDAPDWTMDKRLARLPSMDLAELIWRMQYASWRMSSQTSIRACKKFTSRGGKQRTPVVTLNQYTRDDGTQKRYFGGLHRCGSRQCPRCAQIIAIERARQLANGLTYWFTSTNAGGQNRGVAFLTLTMKHSMDDQLGRLLTALRAAKDAMFGGYPYLSDRGIRQRFRIAGVASTIEVTWGRHGYHPHLHILLMIDRPTTAIDLARLGVALHYRWERFLATQGIEADLGHTDVRPVQGLDDSARYVAAYLNKNAPYRIAHELTGEANKKARTKHGWTFFELLGMLSLDRASLRWFPLQPGQQVDWDTPEHMTITDQKTGEIIRAYPMHGVNRMWRIIHELEHALKGVQTFRFGNRPRKLDDPLDRAWNDFLDHTGPSAEDDQALVDNRTAMGHTIKTITAEHWLSDYTTNIERIIAELKPDTQSSSSSNKQ